MFQMMKCFFIINYYNTTDNSNDLHNNHNTTVNRSDLNLVNDVKISNELKFDSLSPEEWICYSSYSVICDNLYNDIKNKSGMPKYVIGVLLEMSHVINNTTNKSIVLNRLLDQIKQFKNMFSNMKKISTIMLNEPTKIHHKHMFLIWKKVPI